jgi:hypothetical protein
MVAKSNRDNRSRTQIENAARAAIELGADRTLTDPEWAAMRTRLLEFAGILRRWDREKTGLCERGNVEVLCQRET